MRRLFLFFADLLAAAYLFVMLAGLSILPRLPDRAVTDAAWAGCRLSQEWGVSVHCPSTPLGWFIEWSVESAATLVTLIFAFLSADIGSGRPALGGYIPLAALALAQLLLVLWALWRVGTGLARMIARAAG